MSAVKLKKNEKMKGYKALFFGDSEREFVDKEGKYFELGKEYFDSRGAKAFFTGFEFRKKIADCLDNYPLIQKLAILEIEASEQIDRHDNYYCASKIKIKKLIKELDVIETVKGYGNLVCQGMHESHYCNNSSGVSESQNCGFVKGVNKSTNLYLSKGFYNVNFAKWGEGVSNSNNIQTSQGVDNSYYIAYSSAQYKNNHVKHSTAVFGSLFIEKSKTITLSFYVIESMTVHNCLFIKNCQTLTNCMFCNNIKNKEFYIFNKKYPKAEYWKHYDKIEKILKENRESNKRWHPFKFFWYGDQLRYEENNLDFSLEKKAKEFPPELLQYIKKNFIKSEKEEEIFESIFQYKIGDCK